MPLPTLPTPPSRDDPTNFSPRADAFLAALPAFGEAANSLEQSLQMVATTGTSTTSLAIGTGSKTLTTQAGKAWVVGAFVYIASSASVANLMFGQITAYNSTTGSLTVNVFSYTGSGTLAAWSIGLSVPRGGTETFSGTVYASRFEIDSGFALYLSGGVSTILLDTNDLLRFTRSTNTFDVVIGGTAEFSVTANGPERPDDASTANGLVRKSQMDAADTAATSAATTTALGWFTGSNQGTGYQKLPGGRILQWGTHPGAGADVSITFPIAFPTAASAVVASPVGASLASNLLLACAVDSVSATSFTVRPRFAATGSVGVASQGFQWFAIGS